jgi:hypothetical protein
MDPNQQIWREWARKLHAWGVQDWAAAFLEAAGPLTLLGAQLVYLGQPLLRQVAPNQQLLELAALLEEPERAQAFAAFLREGPAA